MLCSMSQSANLTRQEISGTPCFLFVVVMAFLNVKTHSKNHLWRESFSSTTTVQQQTV